MKGHFRDQVPFDAHVETRFPNLGRKGVSKEGEGPNKFPRI